VTDADLRREQRIADRKRRKARERLLRRLHYWAGRRADAGQRIAALARELEELGELERQS